MELNVNIIEQLMDLMETKRIDQLRISKENELHLVKTKFQQPKLEAPTSQLSSIMDEEELLFHSTSAPALTPEMVQALAINPPPIVKKKSKKESNAS